MLRTPAFIMPISRRPVLWEQVSLEQNLLGRIFGELISEMLILVGLTSVEPVSLRLLSSEQTLTRQI